MQVRRFRFFTLLIVAAMMLSTALGQIAVPTFGTRGTIDDVFLQSFMTQFRRQISLELEFEVNNAEVITQGVAGSLQAEMAFLITDVMKQRYAITGELSQEDRLQGKAPYSVRILIVDSQERRSSDIISLPLSEASVPEVVQNLAGQVSLFITPTLSPEEGTAALFVVTEPLYADILIDGVKVAETPLKDALMLKPGPYEVEVRKEGFIPNSRLVTLQDRKEMMERFTLTPLVGGSIQLKSQPDANVLLDGVAVGKTPLTLQALPGNHSLIMERPGFQPSSFNVRVENYRVSRVNQTLEPLSDVVFFWEAFPSELVFINGVLQTRDYQDNLEPGSYQIDLRSGGEKRSFTVTIAVKGAYRLDFSLSRAVRLE